MSKKEPNIGDICRSKCTAIGRYIGKGKVLYVSAMTNDLSESDLDYPCENPSNLPLPDMNDVYERRGLFPIINQGEMTIDPGSPNEEKIPYRFTEKFKHQVFRDGKWVSLKIE